MVKESLLLSFLFNFNTQSHKQIVKSLISIQHDDHHFYFVIRASKMGGILIPLVINFFSCLTQLSIKFQLLLDKKNILNK